MESSNNIVKMELVESQVRVDVVEKENSGLRRDKEILTDHVADLQRQVIYLSIVNSPV